MNELAKGRKSGEQEGWLEPEEMRAHFRAKADEVGFAILTSRVETWMNMGLHRTELQNTPAAVRIVNAIMDFVDQPIDFAEMGAPLSSLLPESDYRFLVHGNYLTLPGAGRRGYVDRVPMPPGLSAYPVRRCSGRRRIKLSHKRLSNWKASVLHLKLNLPYMLML